MASEENKYHMAMIYRLIYAFVRIVSFIPFRTGQFLGRLLGRAFAMVPVNRTRDSLDNLRHAFGDQMTDPEIKRLNRLVVMHFGQMLFEVPHILRLNPENLDRYVVFENTENLLAAVGKGKGVFILSAHLGNWELMAAAVALLSVSKTAAVARSIDFSPADRLVRDLRTRFGAELIPKRGGMKKVLKAVKEKKTIGILLDQSVDWYEGVFVQFLGRPACTNKGLALLAQRTGAPVVPAFSARRSDGRYSVIFEKEVELQKTGDRTRDIEENTAIFTRIIEKYIRQCPEQWFWFHRRWKVRPYCPLPDDFGAKDVFAHGDQGLLKYAEGDRQKTD